MHGGEFTHPSVASLADPLFRKQKEGQEMCYFTLSTASGKEMSK